VSLITESHNRGIKNIIAGWPKAYDDISKAWDQNEWHLAKRRMKNLYQTIKL
jgi:hypothetical protein